MQGRHQTRGREREGERRGRGDFHTRRHSGYHGEADTSGARRQEGKRACWWGGRVQDSLGLGFPHLCEAVLLQGHHDGLAVIVYRVEPDDKPLPVGAYDGALKPAERGAAADDDPAPDVGRSICLVCLQGPLHLAPHVARVLAQPVVRPAPDHGGQLVVCPGPLREIHAQRGA